MGITGVPHDQYPLMFVWGVLEMFMLQSPEITLFNGKT